MTENKEQTAGDQSYFEGHEGEGLGGFTPDTVSTAYLSMVQPGSTKSAEHEPGTWINSATNENYGKEIEVIVMAFKTVWTERDSKPPYITVGRYDPNSIPVDITRPKPGQRGFPKMTNPTTGNKIEELFIYAMTRPDYPEEGIIYFSPTAGSMRTCKSFNKNLSSQRILVKNPRWDAKDPQSPTFIARPAPIFGYTWFLSVDLVPNPAKPGTNEKMAKFVSVRKGRLVEEQLFKSYVEPQIAMANDIQLLAAPESSGDVETE